jgi:predicted DNA-binding transcriptional regulator YafY
VPDSTARLLRLLSLLQTHRYWPGGELANRLEVSVRTLRRDVDRLRELGYPVQAQRGVAGGYQLAAGAALPPLVLDDEEAVALAVALMNAAGSSVAGIAESAVSALAKVTQVLPRRLQRRVAAVRGMTEPIGPPTTAATVSPAVLATVAQACRDSDRIEFGYLAADGTPTERRVEPHRLVSLGRRWYLVGYDLTRHEWRTFRLDRLREPRPTGVRFAPRRLPAPDAASFVRSGLRDAPTPYRITAEIAAPADHVRDRIGRWAEVDPRSESHCTVRIRTDSMDWAVLALGMVGADFRVTGPSEFSTYLGSWADRLSRAAERTAPS